MLGNSCFNLQERLLPYLRSQTARRLSEKGLRQNRIAEHLGVSQAMVSKYLRTMMAAPKAVPASTLSLIVARSTQQILEEETKGRTAAWCTICPQLSDARESPRIPLDECLRGDEPVARDETTAVLANLKQAAARLRTRPFARLAPQVQANLAMSTEGARDARGVAAFPGRFVEVRNELRPVADPEFGASSHLSTLLLAIRSRRPNVRAILCLRYGTDIKHALTASKLRVAPLRRTASGLAPPAASSADAFVDPGDFGIEPITYVVGETALDAVTSAERILSALAPE